MKKLISILLCVGILLSFAACSKEKDRQTGGSTPAPTEAQAENGTALPTAEQTPGPTAEPTEDIPFEYYTEYENDPEAYRTAAEALLAGEIPDDIGFLEKDDMVYYHIEDDGLKVYTEMTEHTTLVGSGVEYEYTYGGLIAALPKELADRADKGLHAFAESTVLGDLFSHTASLVSIGYYGGSYAVFVTVDDSMQDFQCISIFALSDGEWREIPACRGVVLPGREDECTFTISGAYADGDTAYLCYGSKWLWDEETGWRYPYVYRTEDGGASWQRIEIALPEEFEKDVGWLTVYSPVFDGEHGVMIIKAFRQDARLEWLETFDGGDTWEYKTANG